MTAVRPPVEPMLAKLERTLPRLPVAVIPERGHARAQRRGGVDGRGFAQTEIPGRPPWVRSVPIMLAKGEEKRFTLADDHASLAWLGSW